MAAITGSVVNSASPQEVGHKARGPSQCTPRDPPRTAFCQMGRKRFFTRSVEQGSIEVKIRCNIALHEPRLGLPYMSHTDWRGRLCRFFWLFSDGGIDASACSMILPPRQGLAKISSDEKPNFSRGEPVVAEFLVVVQSCNDGLRRAARISGHEVANLRTESFEPCTLLGSLSSFP